MTRVRTSEILKKVRSVMNNKQFSKEVLHAYIVPSGDSHQSEYIAACDARRAFITGFTGSAGTAVITEKHAALWTDGRYFVQAIQQLDENWSLMKDRMKGTPSIGEWLNEVLPEGSRIGFDPYLVDYNTWDTLKKVTKHNNMFLVPVEKNLIDVIWENKPDRPRNPIDFLPEKYSGQSFEEKMLLIRKKMVDEKVTTLIITALDQIAWIFNLRGSDIAFNPVFFSYAVITKSTVYIFVDRNNLSSAAKSSLVDSQHYSLQILPYESIVDTLKSILSEEQEKVWVSKNSSYAIVSLVPEKNRFHETNIVEILKSRKNKTEIAGAQYAHIKDAAAVCEFFYWLSREISKGSVTEISAADKLQSIKKDLNDYVGLSFSTISASGPNAAVIHYKATEETNRQLSTSEIYLCDCGTQYRDGTTDITRTWHFGEPSPFEKVQ